MRILKIRFKNLNSLVGEWEIDLTHPAFVSDGIFAIIGPTGSGKSTILDAICLALYGRTPRLNKVTKSENEIMARQTGECFSEVLFQTQAGRFRCHWSQRRARKKPDGELQTPKHEIADADSNQILDAKLRGVAEQIEMATGMDFDRFTRSMLLAQGGFAAFLQAVPDERAPILEQITGTEIYSQISMCVHERRSDERKILDLMMAELAGVQLLGDEEEQQLNVSLDHYSNQEVLLNQEVTKKNLAMIWLEQLNSLEKDLGFIIEQLQDLRTRQEVFKPELERLERAKKALEISAVYADISALRREQERANQECNDSRLALPGREAELKTAVDALKLAVADLEQKRIEQKATLVVIRKVQALDIKLQEKKEPIIKVNDVILEIKRSLSALFAKNNEDCRDLATKRIAFAEVRELLLLKKADEGLIANLAGIGSRFDILRDLNEQYGNKAAELSIAEMQMVELGRAWHEQTIVLAAKEKELNSCQHDFVYYQSQLKETLAGRTMADWHGASTLLKERSASLQKTIKVMYSLTDLKANLDALNNRQATLTLAQDGLVHKIQVQVEQCGAYEREVHLLETQLSLLQKIEDLAEVRHQLEDDQPCPLCGAKEHPFATGNIPVPDETMALLKRARENHKQANVMHSGLKIKQVENVKDLEQLLLQQNECIDRIAIEEAEIQEAFSMFALDVSAQERETVLVNLVQEIDKNLENTLRVAQVVDEYEQKMELARESFEKSKELFAQSERENQTVSHKKTSAEQGVARIAKELSILDAQRQKTRDKELAALATYGIKSLALDALAHVQLELAARRDQYLDLQKQNSDLEKQIASLESQTKYQAEQINKLGIDLKNQQNMLMTLKADQDLLMHERNSLFGDRNPNEVEIHLVVVIEAGEKRIEGLRQTLSVTEQECAKLKSAIESIEKTIFSRRLKLQEVELVFKTQLDKFNFADEVSYLNACLSEDARKNLMLNAQKLENEYTELETRRKDKADFLEIERQRQVTEQSYEFLAQERSGLISRLKEIQQAIGAMQQKLEGNDRLRKKQQERVQAIDLQKRESWRWDTLHGLIGSSDGKKYRNFAQGLTFEMMIGHANRQLLKMTDRYLLIRDDSQPLELNVVDNYQAGEIRSTKNLSGGESFIVSLSLALGLSHMASKNVRVDSLFLDEGFGTLDEEALDTALETLAGLQQAGKLIGVISHVPTLKERISTRIQISHQTGGRSLISGPGCRRLD